MIIVNITDPICQNCKMTQIDKILIEIQRIKNDLNGYSAREGLEYIESYINIIQREDNDTNSKELDETPDHSLTWEDMRLIHEISEDLWEPNCIEEVCYKEVLKRFNEARK